MRQAAGKDRYVLGAVGPSPHSLTIQRRYSFEGHVAAYAEQVRDLWRAGVDAIHLAYQLDAANLQVALDSVRLVEDEAQCRIPTLITVDLNPDGTMLTGETLDELWPLLQPYAPAALGLASYRYGQHALRRLRDVTDTPLGLLLDPAPSGHPQTGNRPVSWRAECLEPLLADHRLSYCGLSCTVPSLAYVQEVARLIRSAPTRPSRCLWHTGLNSGVFA